MSKFFVSLLFFVITSTHAFSTVRTVAFANRNAVVVMPSASKSVMFMASPTTEDKTETKPESANGEQMAVAEEKEEEELSETQKLMKQVKESGTAGIVSYALWELAFWFFSVPVCIFGYRELTGHWPDLSNSEDLQKLGAEAFAFVNFARFAVPLRIGLALSTTPWIQENVIDRLKKDKEEGTSSE